MDEHQFAAEFGRFYREVYARAVRRVDDPRQRLSPETTALLLHLAQVGPLTLSELAPHLERSMATLSAKIAALESSGLLARQRSGDDARRTLIWLTPAGRAALASALEVLDTPCLAAAARALDEALRERLVADLRTLVSAIPTSSTHPGDPAHEPLV